MPGTRSAALPPAEVARIGNELYQAYLAHRRQDAFDLLAVSEEASPEAIASHYCEFACRFAPWRFARPELIAFADKARELFLAGAGAYAELAHTESRGALLFRRRQAREEETRRQTSAVRQIKTDLLDPETQFRKGVALKEAGRLKPAIQQLEFAADCDPGNALYQSELAWCRFLAAPQTAAEKSLAALEQAIRLDPQAGLALFYAGEICRETGDRGRAEAYLRRAIRPMSPDRRPLDALAQLAAEKRR